MPSPANQLKGPVRRYTGAYRNLSYNFAVQIPKGLVGLDAANPDYQRGFVISLPHEQATLTVSAETNSLDYPDARAAAEGNRQLAKERGRKILTSHTEPTTLDGEPAQILHVRYTCPPSPTEYLAVETIALSPEHGYLYEISQDGPASKFNSDAATLAHLKRTWKFLKTK